MSNWESDSDIGRTLKAAGVEISLQKLSFASSVHSVGPGDVKTPEWDKYIASYILRKLPRTMEALGGTLLVMEELQKLVTNAVKSKTEIKAFAQFLITDMFTFNDQMQQWEYTDRNWVKQPWYTWRAKRRRPRSIISCLMLCGIILTTSPRQS